MVGLLVDAEPAELVLLPVKLLVLPLPVLGVSLRTCFVTASQHLPALVVVVVALGEVVVVVDVCATASPRLPASIAAAITSIPIIRMQRVLLYCSVVQRRSAVT